MNNKTKGAIAGVAGVALLAGGTTFALWSQTETVDAGVITAGNLEVATADESVTWRDVTDSENSEDIADLDDFRIVPGDTIAGTFPINAALEGDNMLANLTVTLAAEPIDGNLLHETEGVTVTYSLLDALGTEVSTATNVPLGESRVVQLWPDNEDVPVGVITVPATLDQNEADLTVVVTADFALDAKDLDFTEATADLQTLGVTLAQVRSHDG